jgi:hypothetical protein
MNIYLMKADSKTADDMAAWLCGHIGHVGVVIYQPDEESLITAKALAKALGSHIADTALPEQWGEIQRLAQQSTDIAVVTSTPAALPEAWGFHIAATFEPGAIAMLTSGGTVCWLVTPAIVLKDKVVIESARKLVNMFAPLPVSESQKAKRSKKLREAADSGDTEKSWVGGTCDVCQENADAGWIDMDDTFPSGDDEPPAHPHCDCDIETRDSSDEEEGL